ncbi:MAG: hypothetical protein WAM39_31855 [Bryobacteraceae bacterium]
MARHPEVARLGPGIRLSLMGDLIEDRWVGSPVDAVINSNVRDETADILKTLSPKEEKVIRLRFGIGCWLDESGSGLKHVVLSNETDYTDVQSAVIGRPTGAGFAALYSFD